jgi:hypothetical protein
LGQKQKSISTTHGYKLKFLQQSKFDALLPP